MKKLLGFIFILLPCLALATSEVVIPPPPLNIVHLQLQVEQWAKTQKAKVIISFNGTMQAADLATAHSMLLKNLSKFASNADWHITQFNRSQDKSGLETVYAVAEARLPENQLANLRPMAKKLTQPGATFEIADIQFTPSLDTLEGVRNALRHKIYQQAEQELMDLSALYPKQHYVLHKIIFNPMQVASMGDAGAMNMMTKFAGAAPSGMAVSLKVFMVADVEFAAMMQ